MLDAMASAVLAFAVASVKVATGRNLVAFCCGCAYRRRTNRITLSVVSAIIGLPLLMASPKLTGPGTSVNMLVTPI